MAGLGKFITFEGGEGVGKSTQARLLKERLEAAGRDVVVTREPGGSPFAEAVRALILAPDIPPHAPLAEALLFYTARADHLEQTIRPALARGAWVICDRFSDSTRVYQSLAGKVPLDAFQALERLVVGATRPDLTLVLDMAPEAGLKRAVQRGALSRYDARGLAYHAELREGFLAVAKSEPERCALVDAGADPIMVAAEVWRIVAERLGPGAG